MLPKFSAACAPLSSRSRWRASPRAARARAAGPRGRVSQPRGEDHRLSPARRRPRHRRARGRGPAGETVGPAVRGGEPARRRRQSRHRGGRAGRARRLHAAGRAAGAAHHQRGDVQEAQLRSRRARAARDHDLDPEHAGGAHGFPRQLGAGADRLCQGQSGQGQFRLAGRRHHAASHRRIVRARDRNQAHPRALSRHRAGGERSHCRASRSPVLPARFRARAGTRPSAPRCWR